MLSGCLSTDAPALRAFFEANLASDVVPRLDQEYSEAIKFGAGDEPNLSRPADASFNPRPARICRLLIDEAGIRVATAFRCALWVGLPSRPSDIENILSESAQLDEELCCVRAAVVLAERLDTVRHLHMNRGLTLSEKISLLDFAETHYLPLYSSNVRERLSQKLSHAIKMQRRLLTASSE